MTFNPFISPSFQQTLVQLAKIFNKQDEAGHLMCNLIDKDKISTPETGQDTRPVYEYTRPVVRRVGGGEGGTKSSAVTAKLCTAPCYQTQDTPLCLLLTIECIQKRSCFNAAVRSLAGDYETTETAR